MLIDIPALAFLNDIDEYFGSILMKHMKVHHRDILVQRKDDFLLFDYTDIDYKVWYNWFYMLFISCLVAGFSNIFVKNWKYKNFDLWYERKFILKESE
jgi:hypothetical protein